MVRLRDIYHMKLKADRKYRQHARREPFAPREIDVGSKCVHDLFNRVSGSSSVGVAAPINRIGGASTRNHS